MTYKYSDYYTEKVASNYRLDELKSNPHFMNDAKKFLRGDRLNFTHDEINVMSKDDIVNRIQEHFRFRSSNPTTIVKDLAYMDRDTVSSDEKEAYARLSFAFENSQGEGMWEAAGDYFQAEASNPVNWASLVAGAFTGGLASFAIKSTVKKGGVEAAKKLLNTYNKNALKASIAKGALGAGSIEGGLAHYNENMLVSASDMLEDYEKERNIDYDYDYSLGKVGMQTGLAVGLGGSLGGLTGKSMTTGLLKRLPDDVAKKLNLDKRGNVGVVEDYFEGLSKQKTKNKEADKLANELLQANLKVVKKGSVKGDTKLERITNALAALDPERVAKGEDIKEAILKDDYTFALGPIKLDRIKRITAAGYELSKKLNLENRVDPETGKPIRITQIIADAIAMNNFTKGEVSPDMKAINDVLIKYNISPSELSALYMAEFSEAGKILREASMMSKASKQDYIDRLIRSADTLNESRFISLTGQDLLASREARDLIDVNYVGTFFRWLNDTRIANMTSQVMTTARNTTFGGAFLLLDAADRVLEQTFLTVGRKQGIKDAAFVSNPTAILKNMLVKREQGHAMQALFEERLPVEFRNLFNKTAQAEMQSTKIFDNKAMNVVSQFGAHVNFLNAFSDHQFKRAVLMGTIDRLLQQKGDNALGTNLSQVLKNGTWNQIPEDFLRKGIDEAYRFSFQSQFGMKGEGKLSQGAAVGINWIKKWIVGTAFIPFPRYVGSQIQFINDYMPFSAFLRVDAPQDSLLFGSKKGLPMKAVQAAGKTVADATGLEFLGRIPNVGLGKDTVKKITRKNPETGKIEKVEQIIEPISRKTTEQALARNITGLMPIAYGYHSAAERYDDGRKTFEVIDPSDGTIVDIRANMGAFALHHYLGDLAWKMMHTDTRISIPEDEQIYKQMALLTIGTDFRGGGQFFSDLLVGGFKGNEKKFTKGISDLIATFGYPASSVKDVMGQFDQRSAMRPETLDVLGEEFYSSNYWKAAFNDNVNILDYVPFVGDRKWLPIAFGNRSSRFLPDGLRNIEALDVQVYGNDILRIDPDYDILEGYDPRYFSPFSRHPLYVRDGLVKQFFGLTKHPVHSELIKEMNRLGISQYKAYNRDTRSNFLDIVTRTSLSATLPDDFVVVSKSDEYRSMKLSDRKEWLKNWISEKVTARKTLIDERIKAGDFDERKDIISYIRGEISSLKEQEKIDAWIDEHGNSSSSIETMFNELKSLEDLSYKDQQAIGIGLLIKLREIQKKAEEMQTPSDSMFREFMLKQAVW